MNIVFSSDENYSVYLYVNIMSILKCNCNVNFYILDLGISEVSRDKIVDLVRNNNSKIDFITINSEDFRFFPKTIKHISIATYARLKLGDYLPNLDKVIYLDVDTLTINSLYELWQTDLSGFAIGACFDSFIEYCTNDYKLNMGLSEEELYFNAGVLVIDLEKFKRRNVYSAAMEYLEKYPDIKYQDQDIMNFIFKSDVMFLNSRFNFMPTLKNRIKNREPLLELETLSSPISIVHYCSETKSWHKKCSHTKCNLFLDLYESIKDKPESWNDKVENVNLFKRLSRLRKDLRDRILYGIK